MKLSAKGAVNAAALLAAMAKQHYKVAGKVGIDRLMKENAEPVVIPIREADLVHFEKIAKQFGAHIWGKLFINLSWVMDLNRHMKIKPLLIAVAIPLAVGGAAALLSKGGFAAFDKLYKPLLTPPGWVFPVAWTLLYVLMGIASYLVYTAEASAPRRSRALKVYGAQLLANFLWPVLFFGLGLTLAALLWLLVLWLLVLLCAVLFYFISHTAYRLMLPYLLWTTYAVYLNLGVVLLN